jgi:hypothetical protein
VSEILWRLAAKVVSRPAVAQWLYRRAQRTPYYHLVGYMDRWWLFNPIVTTVNGAGVPVKTAKYPRCPVSVRLHHILRADKARDKHSHPGSFRTLIAKGWYVEARDDGEYLRSAGDTAVLLVDEFHHISAVSPGGVWTIFIMWDWRGTWGFRTPSGFVPRADYHNQGRP